MNGTLTRFPFVLGGFGAIHVDPPWRFEDQAGRMRLPYRSMSDEEILALPVASLGTEAAHLYLWTTGAHREVAQACVRRWGFEYKHDWIWCKVDARGRPRVGGGHYGRHAHEACLFGVRGKLPAAAHNVPTWFTAPRLEHSRKPDRIFEIAELISPAPRVDIFARLPRPGWTVWGDQVAA